MATTPLGSLARNTPGEICLEILAHQQDVSGLIAFAFTPRGELVWGMSGMVPSVGLMVALQVLHAEAGKLDALITAPVGGTA